MNRRINNNKGKFIPRVMGGGKKYWEEHNKRYKPDNIPNRPADVGKGSKYDDEKYKGSSLYLNPNVRPPPGTIPVHYNGGTWFIKGEEKKQSNPEPLELSNERKIFIFNHFVKIGRIVKKPYGYDITNK